MASIDKGFMKLIFVTTKNNDKTEKFKELVEDYVGQLRDEINKEVTARVELEKPIPVGTDNEFCRIDCAVTVNGRPLFNYFSQVSRLFAAKMKKFAADNVTNDLQFRTAVQIQDRNFFDIGKLSGADLQIKAQDVYFGNLIKHDSFLTHYIVDNDPHNGWYGNAAMMRHYFGEHYQGEIDEKQTMFVDFEHDRRQMIILFPVLWPDNAKENRSKDKTQCVAKLKIEYKSIRRIFCDFESRDNTDYSLKVYLHLKCPPLISIVKFARRDREGKIYHQNRGDLRTIAGDRYTHWIPKEGSFEKMRVPILAVAESPYVLIKFSKDVMTNFVHVLGRLFAANQKPIEIREIGFYDSKKFSFEHLSSPLTDESLRKVLFHRGKEDFAAIYMIDALLSRGAHVKDQLLVKKMQRERFIERLTGVYIESRRLALESLERLLNACDENLDMRPLHEMFEEAIIKARQATEVPAEDLTVKKGYLRLRKVTITPTRFIYEAPELIMGNRVLRAMPQEFPPQRFMRVAFRDDDGSRIQANIGAKFIESFVKHPLYHGFIVADRFFPNRNNWKDKRIFNYLGSSNSQMREQGCYFIEANDVEIRKFRETLGAFKMESVPKLMARFGQCFTQSHVLDTYLPRERYNYAVEYIGGANSQGKEYTFSDGVGSMSRNFAREIAKQLNLGDFVPSCIQSRFRGFKGVHAMNPTIDLLNQWAVRRGIDEGRTKTGDRVYSIDLLFRDSQCKFLTARDNQRYEVVKLSGPSPVALNRPMINILDQVSAMQSYACHKRVTDRIFKLLDRQLQSIASTMTNETSARHRLGEFPRVIMFDALQNMNLTEEPFFRAMLRMAARCTLKKLRTKLQVAIPDNLGRSMLGVVDETGILNYGQVYIRYTVNMQQKRPGPSAARQTITGPVLVTKNPMIVAGDVRMFEAVDVPALRHMCDVIVFPRNGPRPHPDEMAGSDLDGDEYSVIWDPEMYLHDNEPAFDYTPDKATPIAVKEDELRKQMADFFVQYITHDSIGKLATAFLINSDIYGIESEVCEIVAKKHMQAVDFPKTGQPPTHLARSDVKTGKPSEDPPRVPDFKEQQYKPAYQSPRLNGRIFRRIKEIDDVLEISIDDQLNSAPKMDETFTVDGVTERDMEIARNNFNSYKASMENLLQRFGINSEVEIFSNSYSIMRKRISDKEEDDFSFFNTQRLIEEEIENIYSTHRKRLFQQHDKTFEEQVEWPYKTSRKNEREHRIVLRSVAHEPSDALQRLAVAYYRIAYTQGNQKYLSFAWLGADVLFKVRQNRIHYLRQTNPTNHSDNVENSSLMPAIYNFSFDPLSKKVSEHIATYIKARDKSFKRFCSRFYLNKNKSDSVYLIRAYCERHPGLPELLYFCYMWARQNDLLIDEPEERTREEILKLENDGCMPAYTRQTICLTFIQFGLDAFNGVSTSYKPFLEETEVYKIPEEGDKLIVDPRLADEVKLHQQHGGLGKKFIQFLEFVSTLNFAWIKRQTFTQFKNYTIFAHQQHIRLHKAAESSYYRLCFTDDFTVLPYSETAQSHLVSPIVELERTRPAVDGESFIFELPKVAQHFIYNPDRVEKIIEKTGVYDLSIRPLYSKEADITTQFVVTVAGTLDSVNLLRKLFAPTGYINCKLVETMLAGALSSQVFCRLAEIQPPDEQEGNVIHVQEKRRLHKLRLMQEAQKDRKY